MGSQLGYLVEAMPVARSLAQQLASLPAVVDAVTCGSIRRFAYVISEIEIVVATEDPMSVSAFVLDLAEASEIVGPGDTRTSFLTKQGMRVDVRAVRPDQFGSALIDSTGSKAHIAALRRLAIDRGWTLTECGLFDGADVVASETEVDIYDALGIEFIPPPMREGTGEVEVAGAGLPDVVTRDRIIGDLHYHSERSGDGKSSLEEMIEAARVAGYEYVAFTDHGEDVGDLGSSREEMLVHREIIRNLAGENPDLEILFGCELSIGPDGDLDYDKDFRFEFDYCVASIHSHYDLTADEQTARILKALEDPSVNAIGHLTGRYAGSRFGIELDVDVVLEALERTGVALEINGAPHRLDASTELTRRAMARDVQFVIDTDSHHRTQLVRMDYGVQYAQRAWVTANRVVNTWPLEDFKRWVGARRGVPSLD